MDMHRSPRSPGSVSVLFLWFWYNVMDEWIPKKYVPTKEQVNFFMVWYGVAWYKMMLRRAFETWSTPTTFLTHVQPSTGRSTTVGNWPRSCIVTIENLHEAFSPTSKYVYRVIESTGTTISSSRSFAFSSAPSGSSLNTTRRSKGLESYQSANESMGIVSGWTPERTKGSRKRSSRMTRWRKQ